MLRMRQGFVLCSFGLSPFCMGSQQQPPMKRNQYQYLPPTAQLWTYNTPSFSAYILLYYYYIIIIISLVFHFMRYHHTISDFPPPLLRIPLSKAKTKQKTKTKTKTINKEKPKLYRFFFFVFSVDVAPPSSPKGTEWSGGVKSNHPPFTAGKQHQDQNNNNNNNNNNNKQKQPASTTNKERAERSVLLWRCAGVGELLSQL
eukprot:gene10318-7213_t